MKTLYLHIGTPKTASSSIQTYCRANTDKLAEYGYIYPITPSLFYPNIGHRRNAHFLIGYHKDHQITPPQSTKI